jgi:hypothetical protein
MRQLRQRVNCVEEPNTCESTDRDLTVRLAGAISFSIMASHDFCVLDGHSCCRPELDCFRRQANESAQPHNNEKQMKSNWLQATPPEMRLFGDRSVQIVHIHNMAIYTMTM